MQHRTRKAIATNATATAAYAAYIKALRAKPHSEAAEAAARNALAAVITAEAAAAAPGTGFETQSVNRDGTPAVTRTGLPVTCSGMKPGTPFALVTYPEGKRIETGKAWPCGTLDCGGLDCFAV